MPAVITEADSEATVGKEVVRVVAQLKIDVLARGWVEVPLRLQDAGVISATLVGTDGQEQPARLAIAADGSYKLMLENKSKLPIHVSLRLEYAKAFNKTPGRNDVSFAAPQAPVNRWTVHIPESGAKVHIDPLIAATQFPDDKTEKVPPDGAAPEKDKKKDGPANDETVLLAFVGAAPTVRIDWTAKAEGASGLAALASVEAQQVVRVEEAVLRTHAMLNYSISRAELARLTIEVPADQKVVNVSSPNVRSWTVEAADDAQKISVDLFEPTRQSETIQLDLEQYFQQAKQEDKKDDAQADDLKLRSVTVPIVRALDVSRQQGIVLVDVAEGLQVESRTREGLLQLDPADLPPALAKSPHELSFRYAVLPVQLVLDLTKIKPRVVASELVLANLEPEQLTLKLQAIYTIERAGVFELAIDVPAGFDIREVRGIAVAGAQAAQVDTHHLEGEQKTRLVVNLSHKALGQVGLLVVLDKPLDDANLLGPTGKTSDIGLPIPRTAPETIERTDGRLVVYAPESLRVNPGKLSGLRSVSLAEALAGMQLPPGTPAASQGTASRAVSSFVFVKAPAELSLQVERRKPYVTVGQLLAARVDPGVVKYEATFVYDIRYSGVKTLRIDLPAELAAGRPQQYSRHLRKTARSRPDDLAKGDVAWSFSGERELLGPTTIRLSWERRLDNLEVGKSVKLQPPHLEPRGTDRAWGQVVLVKSETIDLSATGKPSGLRPIDPQHDLMPGASVPDGALAFEFHDDWSLEIMAARYQLEAVKHTSIERGLVRTVVTQGGQLAVQALYRMRGAFRQRLAVALPEGVEFDTEPLRINGRPTPLERGAKDEFFVPLAGRSTGEPFLLELRYTLAAGQKQVELPAFGDEPAVQKVYISIFLPQELELVGSRGPWTDELEVRDYSPFQRNSGYRYTDPQLMDWVREGVTLAGNPADSFPVDGQAYIFSTLRPENNAAGSLRLTTVNRNWLNFFVFAGVLVLGLLLLKHSFSERVAALTALVIVLVLVGVFLPTLALQIIFGGLWLALVLVALVWIGMYFVQFNPRHALAAAGRSAWPTSPIRMPVSGPKSQVRPNRRHRRILRSPKVHPARGRLPRSRRPPARLGREVIPMPKLRTCLRIVALLAAGILHCLAMQSVSAQPALSPMVRPPMAPSTAVPCAVELPKREIFVPLADLSAILLADVERVFVTRAEYEALEAKALAAARPAESTQPAAVLSAQYKASIEENRARLAGHDASQYRRPDEALSARRVGPGRASPCGSATLDDRPAALGRNAAGVPVLFVSGAGRHELKLEILATVETAAAERSWSFQIPTPPATRLRLDSSRSRRDQERGHGHSPRHR